MQAYHLELGQDVRYLSGVTHGESNVSEQVNGVDFVCAHLLKSMKITTRLPLVISSPSVGQSDWRTGTEGGM